MPARFFHDLAETTGGTVQVVEPFTAFHRDTARIHYRARPGHDGLTTAFMRALEDFRTSYVLQLLTPARGSRRMARDLGARHARAWL